METVNELVERISTKDGGEAVIRPVKMEDAPEIIEAVKDVIQTGVYIQKEQPRTLEEERQFISDMMEKDNMYAAIEIDGKVYGIARVIRGELKMKRHTGLFRTWLHSKAQGLGIGREIMSYTLNWCRLHRLHKLCLTVFSANKAALSLYEKSGFIIEGVQKEQVLTDGKYEDEVLMAYFFERST
ncbi:MULTISPECIES: GNAT family N-acetyltransferase [Bacillus]|uniref:GNAT family N-acetyltransferase n=1 Tax=Bacillus TaxID=1386 RepID=UPI0012B924A4|nr:GNAT family protein [Bacillus haynesii]TWK14373.1 dTDP-fucosamine acetyltransferase [Bacillus licheniformis]MCY7801016.1 GNAT family N-acetyltransferase [Bacillus haynesii]MCY7845817.1 GNAT family N-acetyltransferase [Bacillus haynesii]MCY8015947.1 GNAT family N-acetyltransferase [Bacillus haynesii]MCY8215977.1 GNAT family N-acetyltransferase [Bacillus haynesii]